jgi:hypothetical protein
MNDDDLKAELDRLEPFEGRCPWMYLDNAEHPNVTCGVGYLLASVDDAAWLPWHHLDDGLPASRDEITADFLRVQGMRGGMLAASYKGNLRLAPNDIDAEGIRRLRAMIAKLQEEFPGYDGFPAGVQASLLDLRWNVGSLLGWHHLRAACNSVPPNWANKIDDGTIEGKIDPTSAACQCRTANPSGNAQREHRNDWRSQAFLDAAVASTIPG